MSDDDPSPPYTEQHHPQRRAADRRGFWQISIGDLYSALGIIAALCVAGGSYFVLQHRVTQLEAGFRDLRTHGSDEVRTLQGDIRTLTAMLNQHKDALASSDKRTQELYRILLEEKRERR